MKVLLLGNKAELLATSLGQNRLTFTEEEVTSDQVRELAPNLIVSFGYRYLLSNEVLEIPERGVLNLHISLLPWNRGSDPNFWSWLENTPKGVSIHEVARKLDAGPIVSQKELELPNSSTLKQTYGRLVSEIIKLFPSALDGYLSGEPTVPQALSYGTFHNSADLDSYRFLLAKNGWDTVCRGLEEYGEENGLWKDLS